MTTRRTFLQALAAVLSASVIPLTGNTAPPYTARADICFTPPPTGPSFNIIMLGPTMQQGDLIDIPVFGRYRVGQDITHEYLSTYQGDPIGYASYDHTTQTYQQLHRVR